MTVTVRKIGGSVAVIIPKALAREMELIEGTRLDISSDSAAIVLRKPGRRARRPMAELLKGVKRSAYLRRKREFSADMPVGKEIW